MALSLTELESRLGYTFRNPDLLRLALTHSSYSNETGAKNHHLLCNERPEFLGDSVLSIISSDYLYRTFPNLPEGVLTRMRSKIVCEDACAGYASKLGLGDFLLLGKGEQQSGGAHKPAVIADAFEAVLAAIFLDVGGLSHIGRVSDFLLPFLQEAVAALPLSTGNQADCKSLLQEFIQRNGPQSPEYRLVKEYGPDHAKTFEMEVFLDTNRIGHGVGSSKRAAEQAAAADALTLFGIAHG